MITTEDFVESHNAATVQQRRNADKFLSNVKYVQNHYGEDHSSSGERFERCSDQESANRAIMNIADKSKT